MSPPYATTLIWSFYVLCITYICCPVVQQHVILCKRHQRGRCCPKLLRPHNIDRQFATAETNFPANGTLGDWGRRGSEGWPVAGTSGCVQDNATTPDGAQPARLSDLGQSCCTNHDWGAQQAVRLAKRTKNRQKVLSLSFTACEVARGGLYMLGSRTSMDADHCRP